MRLLFYISVFSLGFFACTKSDKNQKSTNSIDRSTLDSFGKVKVTFKAQDGLDVVADYYPAEGADKVIILCHQANFSRASYLTIAPKLVEAGFDCLAVDLRSGKFVKDVPNETNVNALKAGLPTRYTDSEADIKAAILYASNKLKKKVILWGSSYSATLAMMIGRDDPNVVKVVAFSPGVYFGSENTIKAAIAGYQKPIFVTCSKAEVPMVRNLTLVIPDNYLTFFEPPFGGDHGAKVLWNQNTNTAKYYEQLLKFL